MSRKNAKLAQVTDLQCRLGTIILTKKDCDMIASALEKTYEFGEIKDLYYYFKKLRYAHLVKQKGLLKI